MLNPHLSSDTIAAIATGSGVGGVGIVRISGPEAAAICARLLGRGPLEDRRVEVGWVRDVEGARIDQVVAFVMHGPRSFTGEDVAELHGHGGAVNLQRLLRAVISAGARMAEAGEFTRRAFEHGKLDLVRAEGLIAVIEAASERAARQAQAQLAGALSVEVEALRRRAVGAIAELEAHLDFPEQGITPKAAAWLREEFTTLAQGCAALTRTHHTGRALREGLVVALVGPVNAGKSSLLNALVGHERALVAAEPGTTRDFVEAQVEWGGVPVTLVDTAGLRFGSEEVEQRGIELGQARARAADVRLIVSDVHEEGEIDRGSLRVRSKSDVVAGPAPAGVLSVSARTGAGLDDLRAQVLRAAGVADADGASGATVTTERQRGLLSRASAGFAGAADGLDVVPLEMLAIDARSALDALASILGVDVDESILDEVFRRFCIGK